MSKYRLDEFGFLRGRLSRNRQVWIEAIEVETEGDFLYTGHYVQVSLVKLLRRLR